MQKGEDLSGTHTILQNFTLIGAPLPLSVPGHRETHTQLQQI